MKRLRLSRPAVPRVGRGFLRFYLSAGPVLIAAFLWVNEFPDYRSDLAAGKRTWVVRLGRRKAARLEAVPPGQTP